MSKSFHGICAVDRLELMVPPGMITALVGPSGCGKTTLLRLVAGLEVPDGGWVLISDQVVA
ncbi:MAG TPA: ATP-binding cassette domain-containing protein, partial [bacterium]|nr:ATP-binding cassette domain-containing protein [bacterium]